VRVEASFASSSAEELKF